MAPNEHNGRASKGSPANLAIGQPFNPHRSICGFYPPDIVGCNKDLKLTDGQKRLYERSVRWAGKNGKFWRSYSTIAQALGKSVRQVKDDMRVLEENGLIRHTRRQRQSNVYHFLWHPIFEVQGAALQDEILKVQDTPLEVQDNVKNEPLKVQSTAPEFCPSLNFVQESSSETVEVPTEIDAAKASDDDTRSMKENPVAIAISVPTVEAGESADRNPEDRETLVKTACEQLRLARASGLRGCAVVAEVTLPDSGITEEILRMFADYTDFTSWLEDTIRRRLAWKAKDSRWGLYLADAKNHAKGIALAREKAEERKHDAEIERQRREDAASERERIWNTATEATAAIDAARRQRIKIPAVLRQRLTRLGDLISPADVERRAFAWRPCPTCSDCGTVGNPLQKTLTFCGCVAAEEVRFTQGYDWPAREIARVHATAQSAIVTALHDLRWPFMADAVEASEVIDDGTTVTITVPPTHTNCGVEDSSLRVALSRAGWVREVSICGSVQPADRTGRPSRKAAADPPRDPKQPITQEEIDRVIAERRREQALPEQPPRSAAIDFSRAPLIGGLQ